MSWVRGTSRLGRAKKSDDFVDLECVDAAGGNGIEVESLLGQETAEQTRPPSKTEENSGERPWLMLADNGKPTFFNRDFLAADSGLIGDITPQNISRGTAVGSGVTVEGAAAWNSAGTWEEKSRTKWANERLLHLLESR
jgi:hypothetical protein